MTELELDHLRREKWRLDGEPIRTLEEARAFVDSIGFCLMYPTRPMPVLPTFVGACIGNDKNLPGRKQTFADPRAQEAEGFLNRMISTKSLFEAQINSNTVLLSPSLFPYFYALASDRKPRQPIQSRDRSKGSLLSEHAFRELEKAGPLNRRQLQERLGGALSEAGLDRALHELWAALKITRTGHDPKTGETWDLYYRWAPDLVNEGVRTSDAEALSALISKYLDCVIAATQDEVVGFFAAITSRARVAEVLRALLAAREFVYTPSETRTLITVAHAGTKAELPRPKSESGSSFMPRRRRNG